MRKAILAGLLLTMPAAVLAAEDVAPGSTARSVVVEVREGGRVVASSTAKLQLGRPAVIAMDGPFAMRLRVDAAASGYDVRPHLTAKGPAGWTTLRSPALAALQGQPAKTLVERPEGPPVELAVTIN